jgi:hypothetical protein
MATAPTMTLGALRPEDAIAAFQQRGLLRPSFRWQDVWQAEHTRAFAVAGVARLDVLADIRAAVDQAVEQGIDLATFSRQLKQKLVARGWWGNIEITDPETGEVRTTKFNKARLQLIFDVNMRQSHAAGRWARGMRGKMPLIVYRTMGDERVRVSHRPWDYLVLPREHPWWNTHLPPNGWRCRCTFYFTDQAGVDALRRAGKKIITEPPPTQWVEFFNRSTGATEMVPRGIDPGFAYNPGAVHVQRGVELLERELQAVKPFTSKDTPGRADALVVQKAAVARMRREKSFAEFLDKPPPAAPSRDVTMPVAAMPALRGEPSLATVSALALAEQARRPDFPRALPVTAAGWALAQAIIDQGQRLDLGEGKVLWWWPRGDRVLVLELQRGLLSWAVQLLATLSEREARNAYPALEGIL